MHGANDHVWPPVVGLAVPPGWQCAMHCVGEKCVRFGVTRQPPGIIEMNEVPLGSLLTCAAAVAAASPPNRSPSALTTGAGRPVVVLEPDAGQHGRRYPCVSFCTYLYVARIR